ncbi:MAG: polyprenyl synthetase family protein [Lachnospiraceae bacterium]|nr:polyprenyl synthetase family protein [Lachnospiraceae bacterium]
MNIKAEISKRTEEINDILEHYLPKEEGYPKTVLEAMNYSIHAGGKRIRPMLMKETYELFGGSEDVVHPFMAAMEMIHTYSLVHDDLPAMDNDMLRRGKPTTHAVYGEAMGILCGDALLNYAYETATLAFDKTDDAEVLAHIIPKALRILSVKAGIYGMVGGQVADVEAEKMGLSLDEDKLRYIIDNKTGALIESSMMIGAILAGASCDTLQKIETIANNVGVAFQIQDDILDVIGDEAVLGKPIGSDERNEKPTYVVLHGLEASKEKVKSLTEEAVDILKGFEGDTSFLEEFLMYLVYREK